MIRIFYTLLIILIASLISCAPKGVVHVVQPGQTLYRISKTYHVPVDKLISSNRIKDGSHINAGDALWIPGANRTRTVSVLPKSSTAKRTPVVVTKKRVTVPRTTQPTPVIKKRATASSSSNHIQLIWPLKGTVVNSFNLTSRKPCKGIDIAAKVGSPIVSAAAGKVIYSGNGITGYGHVVIVEHDKSLFTVYGYNKKILVSSGVYVNSGQQIALVGNPPGSQRGRLHFEVWRNKKAVDPDLHLP